MYQQHLRLSVRTIYLQWILEKYIIDIYAYILMMKHEFKAVSGCLIFLKEREHIPFQTYILDVS